MKKIFLLITISSILLSGCGNGVNLNNAGDEISLDGQTQFVKKSDNIEGSAYVNYEGQAIVSGEYSELPPNTLMGEILCFYPNDETSYIIPREGMNSRIAWFCFSNQEEAKKSLSIDESVFAQDCVTKIRGTALIKISDYSLFVKEAAGSDKAKLEEVISITKEPSIEGCE